MPETADIESGDRILVDKRAPVGRWDCVAHYAQVPRRQAAVRRIVGLPGESIELVGGDVFVDGIRAQKHPREQVDLWFARHDTRLISRDAPNDAPRWAPAAKQSAWQPLGSGGWQVAARDAVSDPLQFEGEITDDLSYNLDSSWQRSVPMGDVRVVCDVAEFSGGGGLNFEWQFGGRKLRLVATAEGAEIWSQDEKRAATSDAFIRPQSQLTFAVRDGLAYVLSDEAELVAAYLPAEIDEAKQESPKAEVREFCQLRLITRHCRIELERLRIDRDIYYFDLAEFSRRIALRMAPEFSAAEGYYLLGDNPTASKDSRVLGPVSASDLIGLVRWRYWPRSRWHEMK